MNLALTWIEGKCLSQRGFTAWAASLRKHSPDSRIVILSPQSIAVGDWVQNVVMDPPGGRPLHRRWSAYAQYLGTGDSHFSHVLFSDSRDLVFQADPFAVSDENVLVVSEQQKTGEHGWCKKKAEALERCVGWPQDLSREEINGGFQVGPLASMRYLAQSIELGMFCGADTDQALINWWFRARCHVPWQFAPPGFYIHGESVKLGRQKIEVTGGIARIIPHQFPATIWHQYDRTGHDHIALACCPTKPPAEIRESRIFFLVAHYKEQLKWLKSFPYQHLVVSKNGSTVDVADAVIRENVGFEAETWAWFFAERYDDLPEIIVCLQGDPFDHVRIEAFRQILKRIETEKTFSYIPISTPGHKGFTGTDTPDHRGIPMRDWWTRLFKSSPPLSWYAPYGAQFAVHRDAVRARPREYWEMIRDNCKTREDACTLERLWQFILMGLP